ncbi:hypothetical protein BOTCAL_0010g00060 [Botryotinia calthae]|uniref:Uncharacterized protein n=1 Tax=Botryotinia calthae TaxID=38488 RepID=A0A4Y8DIM9_9HELO|nr:hypothetical protein BOTCAL_0010g00060 [Botryotinia calthae]
MAASKDSKGKGKAKASPSQSVSADSKISKILLKNQNKEVQKNIKRLEEISKEYAELAKSLPKDVQPLVLERPSFVTMLEPLAGPFMVGALIAGVMEAGRFAADQEKIKVGTARKRAARSYTDTFLKALNEQFTFTSKPIQNLRPRSRSANNPMTAYKPSEAEEEEDKAYQEFHFPDEEFREDLVYFIWNSFKHTDIITIAGSVMAFLRELCSIQETQVVLDLSHINVKDMNEVIQSIRSSESNSTVQIMQKAYMQMSLAELMDTAYEEHKEAGGSLNPTRHAQQLYTEWDEKARAAGHNPVDWTEEV